LKNRTCSGLYIRRPGVSIASLFDPNVATVTRRNRTLPPYPMDGRRRTRPETGELAGRGDFFRYLTTRLTARGLPLPAARRAPRPHRDRRRGRVRPVRRVPARVGWGYN